MKQSRPMTFGSVAEGRDDRTAPGSVVVRTGVVFGEERPVPNDLQEEVAIRASTEKVKALGGHERNAELRDRRLCGGVCGDRSDPPVVGAKPVPLPERDCLNNFSVGRRRRTYRRYGARSRRLHDRLAAGSAEDGKCQDCPDTVQRLSDSRGLKGHPAAVWLFDASQRSKRSGSIEAIAHRTTPNTPGKHKVLSRHSGPKQLRRVKVVSDGRPGKP